MQIERFLSTSHASLTGPRSPLVSANGGSAEQSQGVKTTSPTTTWRGLSPEIERWSSRLAEEPEVRPEVVTAARLRLSSGEMLNRKAAEETAAAIIRS
jgi:hypothetical protein